MTTVANGKQLLIDAAVQDRIEELERTAEHFKQKAAKSSIALRRLQQEHEGLRASLDEQERLGREVFALRNEVVALNEEVAYWQQQQQQQLTPSMQPRAAPSSRSIGLCTSDFVEGVIPTKTRAVQAIVVDIEGLIQRKADLDRERAEYCAANLELQQQLATTDQRAREMKRHQDAARESSVAERLKALSVEHDADVKAQCARVEASMMNRISDLTTELEDQKNCSLRLQHSLCEKETILMNLAESKDEVQKELESTVRDLEVLDLRFRAASDANARLEEQVSSLRRAHDEEMTEKLSLAEATFVKSERDRIELVNDELKLAKQEITQLRAAHAELATEREKDQAQLRALKSTVIDLKLELSRAIEEKRCLQRQAVEGRAVEPSVPQLILPSTTSVSGSVMQRNKAVWDLQAKLFTAASAMRELSKQGEEVAPEKQDELSSLMAFLDHSRPQATR